jgi:hypothetical protein
LADWREPRDLGNQFSDVAAERVCWPVMTWLAWLGVVVVIVAIAAVTGFKPKGTRHVAGTRMMGVARFVLFLIVLIAAYLAYRARAGG